MFKSHLCIYTCLEGMRKDLFNLFLSHIHVVDKYLVTLKILISCTPGEDRTFEAQKKNTFLNVSENVMSSILSSKRNESVYC